MGITETSLFYLLIGIAIAVADAGRGERTFWAGRLFRFATAVPFWPLYLPLLLAPTSNANRYDGSAVEVPDDDLDERIEQAGRELSAALFSLDGWVGRSRKWRRNTVAELRAAWLSQATRIREIDQLLAQVGGSEVGSGDGRQLSSSGRARLANVAQLCELRRQTCGDLTASLDRVRELASMIHLARFSGAPSSRGEELIAQLADIVKRLTADAAGA